MFCFASARPKEKPKTKDVGQQHTNNTIKTNTYKNTIEKVALFTPNSALDKNTLLWLR